jgi:hypothetical protein
MNKLQAYAREQEDAVKNNDWRVSRFKAMMADKSVLTNITRDNGRNAIALVNESLKNVKAADTAKRRAAAEKALRDYREHELFSRRLKEAIRAVRGHAQSYLTTVDTGPARLESCKAKIESMAVVDIGDWSVQSFASGWWSKVESALVDATFAMNFEQELADRVAEVERQLEIAKKSETPAVSTSRGPIPRSDDDTVHVDENFDARRDG